MVGVCNDTPTLIALASVLISNHRVMHPHEIQRRHTYLNTAARAEKGGLGQNKTLCFIERKTVNPLRPSDLVRGGAIVKKRARCFFCCVSFFFSFEKKYSRTSSN